MTDYTDLITRIRKAFRESYLDDPRVDDDLDQWYEGHGVPGPARKKNTAAKEREVLRDKLKSELDEAGALALAAATKGLRSVGRWRMVLLGHFERYASRTEENRALLLSLAQRKRDPLAHEARSVLKRWSQDE